MRKAVDTVTGVNITVTSTVVAVTVFFLAMLTGYFHRCGVYLGMPEVKQYKQLVS